ncbi:MAG: hypothetical protein RLY20_884 [Verrucomicrobiota bacterium]|jgi:hypothetical protein
MMLQSLARQAARNEPRSCLVTPDRLNSIADAVSLAVLKEVEHQRAKLSHYDFYKWLAAARGEPAEEDR